MRPNVNLSIAVEQPDKKVALFGSADRHLRMIRDALGVGVFARDDEIRISGERAQVSRAAAVIETLQKHLRRRAWLTTDEVAQALEDIASADPGHPGEGFDTFSSTTRSVVAKTPGQKRYIDTIQRHDLTFCTGPAGTGKTYLAVAAAASMLKNNKVKRIVLVRPAVEAGERLGFLPGDLQAKVNPYLRPLFDALQDMMEFDQVKRFMMNDIIEVIPLAFMRGRTLNHSVVILDEAQNTTTQQMLMFLTRLGHESRMIVVGDVTQVDLPPDQPSGLADAVQRLHGISGVGIVELERSDIVRHKLVQSLVNAYEKG